MFYHFDCLLSYRQAIFREEPKGMDDIIKNKQRRTKVVWMQLGISNEEAERKSKENGIDVIYNR
jgi:predicted CoA-binding protein